MRRDHFFDWHGFMFAAKVLVLCIIAGTVGRYGLLYAAQSHTSTGPSLVLIQETRPSPAKSLSLTLATTTSIHIINTLTVADTIPAAGKFIAVDLTTMVLTLYENGVAIEKYPIQRTSPKESAYTTPAGFYSVLKKESDHYNSEERIDLPWGLQFGANYFVHGTPLRNDGAPLAGPYLGGGIELSTEDAKSVFDFAETGTNLFVFDPPPSLPSLTLDAVPAPSVTAAAYLVADVDTGDVFLEQNAGDVFSIASTTRYLTALVASNAIAYDKKVALDRNALVPKKIKGSIAEIVSTHDLFYPLLMTSSMPATESLSQTLGVSAFVEWMNLTAKSLDMQSTHTTKVGTSTESVSTAEDLFRLATYLTREKAFIIAAAQLPTKNLITGSGNLYRIINTGTTVDSNLSVVTVPIHGTERHAAIIILGSRSGAADTQALTDWYTQSVLQGANLANTACTTCAVPAPYRNIPL